MDNTISAVNQQTNLNPAKQAATNQQQTPSFKSYDGGDSYEQTETQDKSLRNVIIGAAAGLAVLVGAAFGLKHVAIKGSTIKGAENFIENGFLRGVRHVTDTITKPFEATSKWVKGLFGKEAKKAGDEAGEATKGVTGKAKIDEVNIERPAQFKDINTEIIEGAERIPGTHNVNPDYGFFPAT